MRMRHARVPHARTTAVLKMELNPPVPQNVYCYRYPSGCSQVCPFKCVSIFVAGNVPRAYPAGCCGTATGSRAPDLHVRFDSCKHNQCQDRTADLESFVASHRLRCRKYIMTTAQLAEHTSYWLINNVVPALHYAVTMPCFTGRCLLKSSMQCRVWRQLTALESL